MLKLALAVLAAAGLFACAPAVRVTDAPVAVAPADVTEESVTLRTADGRSVDALVVASERVRGVLLFSHGGNSAPAATGDLFQHLASEGFAVIAPTHTDSLALPAERRTDLQGAFPTRTADMQAAARYGAERFAGLPQGAIGYSYGALSALVAGGALSPVVPGRVTGLKAVVMFSSPGPIRGITDAPGALSQAKAPLLMVTGTADTVPGFVTDAAQHQVYFDGVPAGDATLLVVKDATHGFLRGSEAGMEEVAPLALDFLRARLLGDRAAAARFAAAQSTQRVMVRRK